MQFFKKDEKVLEGEGEPDLHHRTRLRSMMVGPWQFWKGTGICDDWLFSNFLSLEQSPSSEPSDGAFFPEGGKAIKRGRKRDVLIGYVTKGIGP